MRASFVRSNGHPPRERRSAPFPLPLALAVRALSRGTAAALVAVACGVDPVSTGADTTVAATPMPEVPASVITVPVTIDLAAFADIANTALPVEDIAKSRWSNDPRHRFRWRHAVRRSPVTVSMTGSILTATAVLDYQLRVCGPWIGNACPITVSCGWHDTRFDPPSREGRIAIHSVLRLTPDYRISSSTSAGPFTYDAANRCQLTFLDIDATPLVSRFIEQQMDDVSAQLDAEAQRRLDFRGHAQRAWLALQQPIDLGGGAFLHFRPAALTAAPIRGSGVVAQTSIGISAHPEVVLGLTPTSPAPVPLPPLAIGNPGVGFHISLPVRLGFDTLSALLTREVSGTKLQRGKLFGLFPMTATVERVSLLARGDSVAAVVSLSGRMKGDVVLTARPTYDAASGRVVLEGLDYDLVRMGLVTRATAWILRSGLRDVLAEHAAWDVGPDVASMRQRLDNALERELAPGVRLSGEIHSLTPVGRGVYPDSASLTILLQADGVLRATVTAPDANP